MRKIKLLGLLSIMILISITACSLKKPNVLQTSLIPSQSPTNAPTSNPQVSATVTTSIEQEVAEQLAKMSLEAKVAQLFITTPYGISGIENLTVADDEIYEALQKYPVGGLIYFADNIIDPSQTTLLTTTMQTYASEIEGVVLFNGIDEEGGRVARIANNDNFTVTKYDSMETIGNTDDTNNAYEVGATIGSYLQEYGFNLDFAPDADVITNPDNQVIGNRSFGSDAELVSSMALACANGLLDNNIIPCFKHFPGHGATLGDTHEGFAYTNKSLDDLLSNELLPFQSAISAQMPMIMVAHISDEEIIGDNTPASLSSKMVTDVLRNQMGFEGLIVTDSLCMGAIKNNYTMSEAAVQALLAGNDMLMVAGNLASMEKDDFKNAYQGVIDAVNDNVISEQLINQAVTRILTIKYQYLT